MSISTRALAVASARRPWRTIGLWLVLIGTAVVVQFLWLGDAFTQELRYTTSPDSQVGKDLLVVSFRLGFRRCQRDILTRPF